MVGHAIFAPQGAGETFIDTTMDINDTTMDIINDITMDMIWLDVMKHAHGCTEC